MTHINGTHLIKSFSCGDMRVQYLENESAQVSMQLLPADMADETIEARESLGETDDAPEITRFHDVALRRPEPLVQIRLTGDAHGDGTNPGRTLRYSSTTSYLKPGNVHHSTEDGETHAIIELATDDGLTAEHHMEWHEWWRTIRVWTKVVNKGETPCSLELVTSFSLGALSPFAADDAPDRLFVHRFRSGWSSEGRHERIRAEDLGLERAWAPFSLMNERFGQRGTKPTRDFFPWIGIEDATANVMWAAHMEAPGSWQCEVGRRDDGMHMAGGMADREFGHWTKILQPDEQLITPGAWLTVCEADVDAACNRLLQPQGADRPAPSEKDMPVMFNEFCTTWGNPSHENLMDIADHLENTPCRYLVIDAGWYKTESDNWSNSLGDWKPSADLFPDGLETTCEAIRKRGLIPGLWFEFEVASTNSNIGGEKKRFLTLDGHTILAASRQFLDFRQESNHQDLEERVLDLIDRCDIGYIKVDYNGSVGIGCDGAESPGEGLRQNVEGVRQFFRRMRERFPELVIENCSSGGQRAEPCFGRLADMHSFSDAHTCKDIPIVAGNMARMVPADQNQIWSVLMPDEDERRLLYSLAATFIGRMCLSGEIWKMDSTQMDLIHRAMDLYTEASPVIREGDFQRHGCWSPSHRHLTGWQGIIYATPDHKLAIIHTFGGEVAPDPLPISGYNNISRQLIPGETTVSINNGHLHLKDVSSWSGAVVLLS